ncbi:glycosyltransferase [Cryobacterium sp. Hh7]|uniref:glycosyltransferase n=1 Tax=Cryobacterium sp. Hh7 TaxID=1259159 RepID=UPI00106C536F|nr:glycosyltransferase [Cryobacterium sp. Hh7]TFD57447.1 glycosyltransferase [Cryobacterium sp. Hh7]
MQEPTAPPGTALSGQFDYAAESAADVDIVIVTYNNAADIDAVLNSLPAGAPNLRLRVVVVDNDSTDETLLKLAAHRQVRVLRSGGNLGYAAGINIARRDLGQSRALLILNPDVEVMPGAIAAMYGSMAQTGAGIVVPLLHDSAGVRQPSLRREPSISRTFGEALFGDHLGTRPGWLSEIDRRVSHYGIARSVEWATGAALLIDGNLAERLGDWDERYFLYSEETDFFRRARQDGAVIWFEPASVIRHRQGGSGQSDGQTALMAVNRVRYAQVWGTRTHAAWIRGALLLHACLRVNQPAQRHAAAILARRRRWQELPQAPQTGAATIGREVLSSIEHVLLTRFNLPSAGPERVMRAQEDSLAERIILFERYCVPSVRAQTNQNFTWIIYFDPESPLWLREHVAVLQTDSIFQAVFRSSVSRSELFTDIRAVVDRERQVLITTNLDPNGALATNFVDRLQHADAPARRAALNITTGLFAGRNGLYLRRDAHNAFCSVRESWDDPVSCWADWHTHLGQSMSVVEIEGAPGWLQVVHGSNTNNWVRGRLVSPLPYVDLFGAQLNAITVPERRRMLVDRLVSVPSRNARQALRAGAKWVTMRLFGPAGLEDIKLRFVRWVR